MAKQLGGGAASAEWGSRGEISVKIDSRVLLCRICSQPLKPPIFKCEAGHVLCSRCLEKLHEVGYVLKLGVFCVLCCKNTSYCRCIEIEEFIDAVKVPCSNKIYGCSEFIKYFQKEKHESGCTHAPCYCPENGCTFVRPTGSLLNHFVDVHGWSPTYFRYNKPLKISMALDCRFTLLLGEDQSMFLLTNTLTDIGHALTVVCVRPHQSEPSYSCNISSTCSVSGSKAEGRLVFQKDPLVSSSSLLAGVQMGKFFLLVPPELVDESSGELIIHIRIDRLA